MKSQGKPKITPTDNRLREFPIEAEVLNEPEFTIFGRYTCFGVTDESGRLVHEFTPTRSELEVLARHYLENIREIDAQYVWYGMTGSHETRFLVFAKLRLVTLGRMLGQERLDKALKSVKEKWDTLLKDSAEHGPATGPDGPIETGAHDPIVDADDV